MSVCFGVLLFVIFVCLFPSKTEKGKRDKLIFALLPIFLMCGLHGDWGGDYESYYEGYHSMHTMGFSELFKADLPTEYGFRLLCWILPTHRSLIIVQSLWICVFLYILFLKIIPERYWSVAMIVVFINRQLMISDIAGIRNGMAVGFFVLAAWLLGNGNKKWFVILTILGGLMHTSCFVLLPLVFLSTQKSTGGGLVRSMIIFIAIFAVSMLIPQTLVDAMDTMVRNSFLDRYAVYLDIDLEAKTSWGLSRLMVFYAVIVALIEMRKDGYEKHEYLMIRFVFVWAIMMILPGAGTYLARFFFYITYVMLAGMMIMAYKTKSKLIRFVNLVILPVYYLYDFRIYMQTEWFVERWQNYIFYFQ